jgi:hypothetical protein
MASIHETAADLTDAGVMGKHAGRECDELNDVISGSGRRQRARNS